MANLSAEEPDALMHARPGPWEPWRVTARATQPSAPITRTRTYIGVSDRSALRTLVWARSRWDRSATLAIGVQIEQPDEPVGGDGDKGAVCFPRRVAELLRAGSDLRDRYMAGEISRHWLAVARGRLESELSDLSPATHPRRFQKPPSRFDPPSSAQVMDAS
jgi:hypothetical protein